MPTIRTAAIAIALALTIGEGIANAQGVAYYPTIGQIPDGVTMSTTPVVSADRRYVRLAINPNFVAFTQFDTFVVPAAVGGGPGGPGALGGLGGLGLGGLGGGGGGGGNGVGGIGGGAGFNQMGIGPGAYDPLFSQANAPFNAPAAHQSDQPIVAGRRKVAAVKSASPVIASKNTRAAMLLRAGESLDKAGKPWAAAENYRRLVREHPGNPLAQVAKEKLAVLH